MLHHSFGVNNFLTRRSKAAVTEIVLNYGEIAALVWKAAGMLSAAQHAQAGAWAVADHKQIVRKSVPGKKDSPVSFSYEVCFDP